VGHPTSLPPPITENSPRPYGQLNSGTVVLSPSESLAEGLVKHLESSPRVAEWKFPDQDLLSEYFKGKWKPLSWYYNALRSLRNSHPAMWCNNEIRCLHYIFADKPWQSRITAQGTEKGFDVMNKWWWDRFDELGKTLAIADPKGWEFVLSTVDKRP
jgi:lipopolysaccharide biosynthesis glycosyltransferase